MERFFHSLKEAQIIIERWRVLYNTLRARTRRSDTGRLPPRPVVLRRQIKFHSQTL
jgi:hypothetical protein